MLLLLPGRFYPIPSITECFVFLKNCFQSKLKCQILREAFFDYPNYFKSLMFFLNI